MASFLGGGRSYSAAGPVIVGAVSLAIGLSIPVMAETLQKALSVTVTSSPNPFAISGTTNLTGSIGVRGTSNASDATGVEGIANGTASNAIAGLSLAQAPLPSGVSNGVFGSSVSGSGVLGTSLGLGIVGVTTYPNQTAEQTAGIYGTDNSTYENQDGVYGISIKGYGVFGESPQGVGVVGKSDGGATGPAEDIGVAGLAQTGVSGEAFSTNAIGLYGIAGSAQETALAGTASGGQSQALNLAVDGGAQPIEVTAAGVPIMSLDGEGNLVVKGTVTHDGAPQSLARDAHGTERVAYSAQQSEATIEDFGEAVMVRGVARIRLESTFASLIDASRPYLVFVTPEGPEADAYVAERSPSEFVVRGSSSASTVPFAYRIVAVPRAVTGRRLAIYSAPAWTDSALRAIETRSRLRMTEIRSLAPIKAPMSVSKKTVAR